MALMLWESFCMSQCLMHVSKHTSLEHMAQWQLYKGRNYRKCVTPWLRVNMWSVHCLQALIPLGPFLDGWRLTTCTSWLGSRCYWGSVAVSFVQSFFYLTLKIENLENGFWKCLHFFKKQEFNLFQNSKKKKLDYSISTHGWDCFKSGLHSTVVCAYTQPCGQAFSQGMAELVLKFP